MATRDAKGSLSAPSLSEENNFQLDFFKTKRPNKRLREEQEAPQIKVDAPSSSNFEVTEPLHQQPTNNAVIHPKKAEYLKAAFKFCRLREKEEKKEDMYITDYFYLAVSLRTSSQTA